jgi:hypothetical protein
VSKSPKPPPPQDWKGWHQPEYTPIPDALFDLWLPVLTEGQLKVLLYIMRRTFGFKKQSDAISLSQLCDGIVTSDGRRLDTGTGCTRSTVTAAVAALVDYGLITATAQADARGDAAPTLYALRMAGSPTPSQQPEEPQVTENETQERIDPIELKTALISFDNEIGGRNSWPHAEARALALCNQRGWSVTDLITALRSVRGITIIARLNALSQRQ